MSNALSRELLAEFFGTFILIVFGVGVVAQVVLSKGTAGSDAVDQHRVGSGGDDGLLCVGRRDRCASESGGDAGARGAPQAFRGTRCCRIRSRRSPARSSRRRSCIVTYHEALTAFDGGVRQVVGAAGDRRHLGDLSAAVPEHVSRRLHRSGRRHGAARRRHLRDHRQPQLAGAGRARAGRRRPAGRADRRDVRFNSGYAINPARDFGPRLFTFVAGWGGEVFRAGNDWWWVPIVAPCVGGVLGGWAYSFLSGAIPNGRLIQPAVEEALSSQPSAFSFGAVKPRAES